MNQQNKIGFGFQEKVKQMVELEISPILRFLLEDINLEPIIKDQNALLGLIHDDVEWSGETPEIVKTLKRKFIGYEFNLVMLYMITSAASNMTSWGIDRQLIQTYSPDKINALEYCISSVLQLLLFPLSKPEFKNTKKTKCIETKTRAGEILQTVYSEGLKQVNKKIARKARKAKLGYTTITADLQSRTKDVYRDYFNNNLEEYESFLKSLPGIVFEYFKDKRIFKSQENIEELFNIFKKNIFECIEDGELSYLYKAITILDNPKLVLKSENPEFLETSKDILTIALSSKREIASVFLLDLVHERVSKYLSSPENINTFIYDHVGFVDSVLNVNHTSILDYSDFDFNELKKTDNGRYLIMIVQFATGIPFQLSLIDTEFVSCWNILIVPLLVSFKQLTIQNTQSLESKSLVENFDQVIASIKHNFDLEKKVETAILTSDSKSKRKILRILQTIQKYGSLDNYKHESFSRAILDWGNKNYSNVHINGYGYTPKDSIQFDIGGGTRLIISPSELEGKVAKIFFFGDTENH